MKMPTLCRPCTQKRFEMKGENKKQKHIILFAVDYKLVASEKSKIIFHHYITPQE